MLTIIPGDNHYLAITAVVTVAMQLFFFGIAYTLQFDKVTDLAGSSNFILIALLTFLASQEYYDRQIMVTTLVLVSKGYLGAYLLARVMKRGHDARFDELRGNFVAFLVFWIFQMVWAWGVSLGVIFINSDTANPPLGGYDWAGLAIFLVGLFFEVVGDLQKDSFRGDPKNRKDFMSSGLWAISRHPNFFGEMMMWWGIFIIGVPVYQASSSNWGYATVLSPLLTMAILLFLSGMPTAEGVNQRRFLKDPVIKERFLEYRRSTSPLIPLPPALYACLPLTVKRVFFFEFEMYETDWNWNDNPASGNENEGAARNEMF